MTVSTAAAWPQQHLPGKFVWFEHVSADSARARKFYDALFGWHAESLLMGGQRYSMIMTGSTPEASRGIGGYRSARTSEAAHWLSYLSVDDVESHLKWEGDIGETQGTPVNFPMIGDPDRKVADLYDMIHPNANDTLTVRSVFVIGPDKKVKLTITYPASTGRNFDEILRVIDSLQLTAKFKVATPANWTDGNDVIIGAAVSDDEAKQLFPQGWTAVKPYLRVLPQPNK